MIHRCLAGIPENFIGVNSQEEGEVSIPFFFPRTNRLRKYQTKMCIAEIYVFCGCICIYPNKFHAHIYLDTSWSKHAGAIQHECTFNALHHYIYLITQIYSLIACSDLTVSVNWSREMCRYFEIL